MSLCHYITISQYPHYPKYNLSNEEILKKRILVCQLVYPQYNLSNPPPSDHLLTETSPFAVTE